MTDDEAERTHRRGRLAARRELQIQKASSPSCSHASTGPRARSSTRPAAARPSWRTRPKKPDAAGADEDAPAAEPDGKRRPGKKKPRRQKLRDSLKALPTVTTRDHPARGPRQPRSLPAHRPGSQRAPRGQPRSLHPARHRAPHLREERRPRCGADHRAAARARCCRQRADAPRSVPTC